MQGDTAFADCYNGKETKWIVLLKVGAQSGYL